MKNNLGIKDNIKDFEDKFQNIKGDNNNDNNNNKGNYGENDDI